MGGVRWVWAWLLGIGASQLALVTWAAAYDNVRDGATGEWARDAVPWGALALSDAHGRLLREGALARRSLLWPALAAAETALALLALLLAAWPSRGGLLAFAAAMLPYGATRLVLALAGELLPASFRAGRARAADCDAAFAWSHLRAPALVAAFASASAVWLVWTRMATFDRDARGDAEGDGECEARDDPLLWPSLSQPHRPVPFGLLAALAAAAAVAAAAALCARGARAGHPSPDEDAAVRAYRALATDYASATAERFRSLSVQCALNDTGAVAEPLTPLRYDSEADAHVALLQRRHRGEGPGGELAVLCELAEAEEAEEGGRTGTRAPPLPVTSTAGPFPRNASVLALKVVRGAAAGAWRFDAERGGFGAEPGADATWSGVLGTGGGDGLAPVRVALVASAHPRVRALAGCPANRPSELCVAHPAWPTAAEAAAAAARSQWLSLAAAAAALVLTAVLALRTLRAHPAAQGSSRAQYADVAAAAARTERAKLAGEA
jgi:hypothetical protein